MTAFIDLSTSGKLLVIAGVCLVLLGSGVLTLVVIAVHSRRQERADKPPTPEPVPPRSGSPFAPKWLRERNARILAEREARRG